MCLHFEGGALYICWKEIEMELTDIELYAREANHKASV